MSMKKTLVILATALAASGAFAQASAPAAPPAAASSASPAAKHEARIENRIAYLHQQLKIAPQQETQWQSFADAMREDGETMGKLYEKRRQSVENASALDNMRDYAEITEAHAEGMKKLVAAFEPLYNSLSPEQKKLADATFRERMGPHHARSGRAAKAEKPAQ
jgi:hypothetical protein